MDSEKLASLLQEFQQAVYGNNDAAAKKKLKEIEDLVEPKFLSTREQGIAVSYLLSKEKNVIEVAKSLPASDRDIKSGILRILLKFFTQDGCQCYIQGYIVEACNFSFQLARNEKAAQVQTLALELLNAAVAATGHFPNEDWVQAINVKDIMDGLFVASSTAVKSVLLCIYTLMGTITFRFIDFVLSCQYNNKIADHLTRVLYSNMVQTFDRNPDKIEQPTIQGCLQGLTSLMQVFTQSMEDNEENCKRIFESVKRLVYYGINFPKHEVCRAALRLLSQHSIQFAPLLLRDYTNIFGPSLKKWSNSPNEDDKKAGQQAFRSVITTLALVLSETNPPREDGIKIDVWKTILVDVLDKLRNLQDEEETAVEMLRSLLPALQKRASVKEVQTLFAFLMEKSQRLVGRDEEVFKRGHLLCGYVHTVGLLLSISDEISPENVRLLELLAVDLIKEYPKVSKEKKKEVPQALLSLFLGLRKKNFSLESILPDIIYQGLIKTVKHPVLMELELLKEMKNQGLQNLDYVIDIQTYKDYISLWLHLFHCSYSNADLDFMKMTLAEVPSLRKQLLDQVLMNCMQILETLDLSTRKEELPGDGKASADPLASYKAQKPTDHTILVNLVDFLGEFLSSLGLEDELTNWLYPFGHKIMEYSYRHPKVSALYRWSALILKLYAQFDSPSTDGTSMEVRDALREFQEYVHYVLQQLPQFRDELLASALQVLLSLPPALAPTILPQAAPALQRALKLGLTLTPMGNAVLDALEIWTDKVTLELMAPLLETILPNLEPYLHSTEESVSKTVAKSPTETKESYAALQGRIAFFLGRLGPDLPARALLNKQIGQLSAQHAVAWSWNATRTLTYDIPFRDIKPTISLDELLPLVVEIATTFGERSTKIAACELLHVSVIYLVGKVSQLSPDVRDKQGFAVLYSHLVKTVIILASDVDAVIKKLFEPLLFQLVRFHARPAFQKLESVSGQTKRRLVLLPETQAVLGALLDGICHPEDTSIRTVCALALNEYLRWTLKHVHDQNFRRGPSAPKELFKKLFGFMRHSSPYKRLGASIAFNAIYGTFRESNHLVDVFAVEFLYYLTECLALADDDKEDIGGGLQAQDALTHLKRILSHEAHIFLQPSEDRRLPPAFQKGTLEEVVLWSWKQCGRPETLCRQQCMALFYELCTKLPGVVSPSSYVSGFVENYGRQALMDILEAQRMAQEADFNLRSFTAILEFSAWLFEFYMAMPEDTICQESQIHTNIQHFLDKVLFQTPPCKYQCFTIVRLMQFVHHALNLTKETSPVFRLKFWSSPTLAEMVVLCALQPQRLAFDVLVAETQQSLSEQVIKTLKAIATKYPPAKRTEFFDHFFDAVGRNGLEFSLRRGHVTTETSYKQLVSGYNILATADILRFDPRWTFTGLTIAESIVKEIEEEAAILSPEKINIIGLLFRLALNMDFDVSVLCRILLNKNERKTSKLSVGGFVRLNFMSVIGDYLRKRSRLKEFIRLLLNNPEERGEEELHIVRDVLGHLQRTKSREATEIGRSIGDYLATLLNSPHTKLVVSLLNQVLFFDDQFLIRHKNQILPWLCTWLERNTLPMETVNPMILLAATCGDLTPSEERKLKMAVEVVQERFPLRSSEIGVTDPKRVTYSSFFETLLNAMQNSPSGIFFELVVPMIFREPGSHIGFEKFLESVRKRMQTLGRQGFTQEALLTKTLELLGNIPDPENMLSALRSTLLPLMDYVTKESFEGFLVSALPRLVTSLDKPLSEHTLVPKITAWDLLGTTFRTLETTVINQNLNRVFCKWKHKEPEPDGKDFAKAMIKAANEVRNQTLVTEKKSLLKKYYCSAYNALIAMFIATQNKLNLFANFFFNTKAGPVAKIVDTTPYKFLVVDDNLGKQKKHFLNLRLENRSLNAARQQSVPYLPDIASQYLTDSSLNEDVSRFDFTHSVVRSADHNKSEGMIVEKDYILLESDSLNDHECMVPLIELVHHLERLSVATHAEIVELPVWMAEIRSRLCDPTNQGNLCLKVFLLRLIFNTESVFKPYAAHFYTPIIRFLVSGGVGSEINSFLRDLIGMLLSWHEVAIPNVANETERTVVNSLWEFVLQKTPYERRDVFRANLAMLRTMVEVWKQLLNTPSQIIYQQLTREDVTEQMAGLQIWGVVLISGLPVYQSPCDAELKEFVEIVGRFLHLKVRDLYEPAAEVLGLFLARLNDGEKSEWVEQVLTHLTKLKKTDAKELFIPILNRMTSRFPAIANEYVDLLLLYLPSLLSSLRVHALECLYHAVSPDKVPRQFQASVFVHYFTTKNAPEQEFALKVIEKLNTKLATEDVRQLVLPLVNLVDWLEPRENEKQNLHIIQCRNSLYNILKSQYDLNRNSTDPVREGIWRTCVAGLMKGLRDEEPALRQSILDFWNDETAARLSNETTQKVAHIFQELYVENEQNHFSSDVVQLLLESTKRSPDYKKPLFEHALEDVHFEELDIPTTRRFRHTTLTPLFAESMLTTEDLERIVDISVITASGEILATAPSQLQFTPTQATVVNESFADLPSSSLLSMDASSYFSPLPKRSGSSSTGPSSTAQSYSVPHSVRFVDRERTRRRLAHWGKRQAYQRKEVEKERRFQREAQVSLTRKYRQGEIPDVQIPHSDLIEPMRALAERHEAVARLLTVKLVTALGQELAHRENSSARSRYYEQVSQALVRALDTSSSFQVSWANTCLEILLDSPSRVIEPDLVVQVSTKCHLEALGIRLLGGTLKKMGLTPYFGDSQVKKARLDECNDHKKTWHSMLRLYEGWGDQDCVRAIAAEHLSDKPTMKEALDQEAAGNWQDALEKYEKLGTANDLDSYERKLLSQGRLKCMAELGKWKLLNEEVIKCLTTGTSVTPESLPDVVCEALWLTEEGASNLAWVIRSSVRLVSDDGLSRSERRACVGIVEHLMNRADSQQTSWLKDNFIEDLALFRLVTSENRTESASQAAENGVRIFQTAWNQLSPLALATRRNKLQTLCRTAEIQEFLHVSNSSSDTHLAIQHLTNRYGQIKPHPKHSVAIWDNVIAQRLYFIDRLRKQASEMMEMDGSNSLEALASLKFDLCMAMVNTALSHRNSSVADTYLHRLEYDKIQNPTLKSACLLVNCRKNMYRKPRAKWLLKSLHDLGTAKLGEEFEWQRHLLKAELSVQLEQNWNTLDPEIQGKAARFLRIDKSKPVELLHLGFGEIEKSKALVKQTQEQGSVHFSFAKYCKHLLSKCGQDPGAPNWANVCIESLLMAMKSGNYDAQLFFPCVLQLLEDFSSTRAMFLASSEAVPSYMFLPWTSQLLARALMHSGAECLPQTLAPILLRLAEDFPQGLQYPFHLSLESRPKHLSPPPFINKLQERLRFEKETSLFLKALTYLAQPSVIALNCIHSLFALCKRQKFAEAADAYVEFATSWLNLGPPTASSFYGRVAKKFSDTYSDKFAEIFGENGEKLDGRHELAVAQLTVELKKEQKHSESLLHEYSPWLASYHGSIDMPGQYQGFQERPNLKEIVKIVRCDANVQVMRSIRMPVVLTLLGNDAKEHKVLVKCGEDLRQDNRLEQIFAIVNKLLQASNCLLPKPLIRTYEVIPLTMKLGIIQWLNDTVPLHDFLYKATTNEENERMIKLAGEQRGWVHKTGGINDSECYAKSFSTYTREHATHFYRELVASVPNDLLRRAILRMSRSPEGFHYLQHMFGSSHGLLSVVHWLLGIGDRHLNNFMVDTRTGECIGIDFGMAFGVGTQFLPVPELLPCRLTPQISMLIPYLGLQGPVEETMTYGLRTLRASAEVLLAAMDVFVREPSLDWLDFASKSKHPNQTDESENTIAGAWLPNEKIKLARQKLEGIHPSEVVEREVRLNEDPVVKKGIHWIVDAVWGRGDSGAHSNFPRGKRSYERCARYRAQMGQAGLTAEEQVKCLIDQATDPALLARAWCGWSSWV